MQRVPWFPGEAQSFQGHSCHREQQLQTVELQSYASTGGLVAPGLEPWAERVKRGVGSTGFRG